MSLALKQDPDWLEFLTQAEASALLIGEDGCQVPVPALLLLAVSPLVRRLCTDHGIPPALSPVALSVPTVAGEVLEDVRKLMMMMGHSLVLNTVIWRM